MEPLIIANFKANHTIKETIAWIKNTREPLEKATNCEIVICPSFTSLPLVASFFEESRVLVGAQTVSQFERGAYTGEVTAEMLDGLISFCIVGPSERKKYFSEAEDQIVKKVENLLKFDIKPLLCISDLDQLEKYLNFSELLLKRRKEIVFVYEPPSAISGVGDFHPESPESAEKVASEIEEKLGGDVRIIYGGSTNPENIGSFLRQNHLNGALVGQASWNPETFLKLVSNASLIS
ncbi:MAG: hypothetical protein A2Y57_02655 [Candidatus Woykebacteria bacterium RBG_13_40_7b]|uniref:Triosephosphate isomerase n=1 Tax=Candidatus Woykebacteria bacterium RBG_13_40_7b TaxID=1802594 RepID=A0A1G1WBI4_9BACT|nr:MAG: hypothetical protein A2Y57_02655 [Candidatus Woykebacteria bacterium RBG_13_40_7b]